MARDIQYKSHVSWKKDAIGKVLNSAEKALVALGNSIRKQAQRNYKAGTSVYGPALDTGRLMSSMSVNWSDSGLASGNVFRQAMSKGKALGGVIAMSKGDAVGPPTARSGEFTVVVGTKVPYAPDVEFGTNRMGARPHLQMAFLAKKGKAASIIAKRMRAARYGGFAKGSEFERDANIVV